MIDYDSKRKDMLVTMRNITIDIVFGHYQMSIKVN